MADVVPFVTAKTTLLLLICLQFYRNIAILLHINIEQSTDEVSTGIETINVSCSGTILPYIFITAVETLLN